MCAKYVHIVTQAQPSSSRGLHEDELAVIREFQQRMMDIPGITPMGVVISVITLSRPLHTAQATREMLGLSVALEKSTQVCFLSYGIQFSSVSTSQIILHLVIGIGRQFP